MWVWTQIQATTWALFRAHLAQGSEWGICMYVCMCLSRFRNVNRITNVKENLHAHYIGTCGLLCPTYDTFRTASWRHGGRWMYESRWAILHGRTKLCCSRLLDTALQQPKAYYDTRAQRTQYHSAAQDRHTVPASGSFAWGIMSMRSPVYKSRSTHYCT